VKARHLWVNLSPFEVTDSGIGEKLTRRMQSFHSEWGHGFRFVPCTGSSLLLYLFRTRTSNPMFNCDRFLSVTVLILAQLFLVVKKCFLFVVLPLPCLGPPV